MKFKLIPLTSLNLSQNLKTWMGRVAVWLIILVLAGTAGYFYWQYRQLTSADPAREVVQITRRISQFMDLPTEPLPTVATVTEKDKLKEQGFFKHAENGDKVLIYLSAGKAILYRPSTQKVIDVAPVTQTDATSNSSAPETAQPQTLSITLLNGTNISGMARTVEQKLTSLPFEFSVIKRGNASRFSHEQTVVFDTTGNNTAQAQSVAELLNGSVGDLPAGESASGANGLVVIIGTASTNPVPTASPAP